MVLCQYYSFSTSFTRVPELLFGAASEQRTPSDWHKPFVAQQGSALSGLKAPFPISLTIKSSINEQFFSYIVKNQKGSGKDEERT